MMTELIQAKLDQLADFQAQKDYLDLKEQEVIDTILTPEIKKAIADIKAEFAGKAAAVDENIAALTADIKQAVLNGGATVKGSNLMAVWVKGRVSWDNK